MAERVTRMLIKVDMQCPRCYRKIKKVLCKFPQVKDQIYDEKQNTVLITVVCCSPEKVRQMIICEGGETVHSIEILLDKHNETEKKRMESDTAKDTDKTKVGNVEPSKENLKTLVPTTPPSTPLPRACVPPPRKAPNPMVCYPLVPVYPKVGVCCCPPGYRGYGGGPCYCGQRRPVMCYDGCGRPVGECQCWNKGPFPVQGRPVTCDDGCGRLADECQCGNSGSLPGQRRSVTCDDGCGRLADECQCGNRGSFLGQRRLVTCDDGCGRPVGECQGGNRGYCVSRCDDGCGRPACECQGGNRGYCMSRCDYFGEENAAACTVM